MQEKRTEVSCFISHIVCQTTTLNEHYATIITYSVQQLRSITVYALTEGSLHLEGVTCTGKI